MCNIVFLTADEFQDVKKVIASSHLDVKQEVTGPQEFADDGGLHLFTYKWYFCSTVFPFCIVMFVCHFSTVIIQMNVKQLSTCVHLF